MSNEAMKKLDMIKNLRKTLKTIRNIGTTEKELVPFDDTDEFKAATVTYSLKLLKLADQHGWSGEDLKDFIQDGELVLNILGCSEALIQLAITEHKTPDNSDSKIH